MKLFKSLLVAPATLGLLAPLSATANEVTISDFTPSEQLAITNSRVDGLEARLNTVEAGGFSETTTASFSLDTLVGAVDGGNDGTEAVSFDYQMNIGLSTSFTGEDSLDVTIDVGGPSDDTSVTNTEAATIMGYQATSSKMVVDGITYTFPLGGATVVVGDTTDISSTFTGACAYSAFTDYMGNCGTGSSVGVGGAGVTAAMSYAFDSGFSLAGGVSSETDKILTEEGTDIYGIEAAYSADSYGVSVAYADSETTTAWGVNGYYAFDSVTLSAGVESVDDGATAEGFFVGLSFPEVGAGSLDLGMGTTGNFKDSDPEYYTYEASNAYPLNDGVTITPGVYIIEGATDVTGVALKTSFSF